MASGRTGRVFADGRDRPGDERDDGLGGSDRRRQLGEVRLGSRKAARFGFSGYRHATQYALLSIYLIK